jgi:hypothetical protein
VALQALFHERARRIGAERHHLELQASGLNSRVTNRMLGRLNYCGSRELRKLPKRLEPVQPGREKRHLDCIMQTSSSESDSFPEEESDVDEN